jgi:spore coat protein U-like protein
MRSSKILAGVSAGVLLALTGGAQAATTTTNFTVTANVVANCLVTATNMLFPDFDGVGNEVGTSTIGVRCSANSPYNVRLNVGTGGGTFASRTLLNGTNTLAYNLYRDAARTEIWGDTTASTFDVAGTGTGLTNTINHTVYGLLPEAGNQNAPAGAYTSTIQVSVVY